MSSWLIVGASRGIGLEYIRQLSADPSKTVIAVIRNQATAGSLNKLATERKNVHVILTDISNSQKVQVAAEEASNITGGGLDVLVFNAFLPGTEAFLLPPSAFGGREDELERELIEPLKVNVIHMIQTVNAFLSLIRKGSTKKLVYITSGHGDPNVGRICEIPNLLGYCVSKAAGNIVMAKYSAELKGEGITTLALSPGWVDTESGRPPTPEAFDALVSAFKKIQPDVTGPITTNESVRLQLQVIHGLNATKSGMVLSQNGNDVWF